MFLVFLSIFTLTNLRLGSVAHGAPLPPGHGEVCPEQSAGGAAAGGGQPAGQATAVCVQRADESWLCRLILAHVRLLHGWVKNSWHGNLSKKYFKVLSPCAEGQPRTHQWPRPPIAQIPAPAVCFATKFYFRKLKIAITQLNGQVMGNFYDLHSQEAQMNTFKMY